MKGVFGKYLDVDLSAGTVNDYPIPLEWQEKHIGGRGIAARIMLKELQPGADALGPDNIMVFATGPMVGTGVAGASRMLVMAKSPRSNAISDSYVGGHFPHELGRSGYDGIIIRGRAQQPMYLVLSEGKAELYDAKNIWGKMTAETDDWLKSKHAGVRVSCIGPAGEKQVRIACVINDLNRAAGRPGMGAVMGSKNLKAIAVKASADKPIADEANFKALRAEWAKDIAEIKGEWGRYGTAGGVDNLDTMGILPTKNFQEGTFEGEEKISGQTMHDTILTRRDTCAGCTVRCKRVVKTTFFGEQVEERYGGPEYETVAAFGSLLLIDDLSAISLANQICNAYGLDTISAGVAIAFAMEATEKGLMDEHPAGQIEWGDAKKMIELLKLIAQRKGVGELLGEGVKIAAQEIGNGAEDIAMHIKGHEIPMHEPRGKKGLGISYATSPRGATHLEGQHDTWYTDEPVAPDIGLTEPQDRFDLKSKPAYAKAFEDLSSFTNSLVMCRFVNNPAGDSYNYQKVRALFTALTGKALDASEMMLIGERNYVLLKLLAARDGYGRKDEGLPERFTNPLPRGGSAGQTIPERLMQTAIDEYYQLRGFDAHGPTDEKLQQLGLGDLKGMITR